MLVIWSIWIAQCYIAQYPVSTGCLWRLICCGFVALQQLNVFGFGSNTAQQHNHSLAPSGNSNGPSVGWAAADNANSGAGNTLIMLMDWWPLHMNMYRLGLHRFEHWSWEIFAHRMIYWRMRKCLSMFLSCSFSPSNYINLFKVQEESYFMVCNIQSSCNKCVQNSI